MKQDECQGEDELPLIGSVDHAEKLAKVWLKSESAKFTEIKDVL